ncbi:MAG: heavy-metal-associated domain-containing protein [Bacteroidetes bacterium]|nr:heavy-metal-associated domain-containing protein [Bacteroidota bacterium]MBV6459920.1 hypothetical protein [Flavobacteriales bacterium]WKZ76433.1 MAG: heavy metal-associated domain-containing protein [Vicingaceae bacterium]MCL4816356.1 heavy-metal-associated domain-containing protein [Flavobacteriales bacterium]NOG95316.1 heavy-metal-associated domain-containing protein [Bacteroidota bacterium]
MKKLIIASVFLFAFQLNTKCQDTPKGTEKIEIKTSAVCGMCKERLEKEIGFTKGVRKATLNKDTKVFTIYYNPKKTNTEILKQKIAKTGYDADDVKADEKAHDKLPDCCKKGVESHD